MLGVCAAEGGQMSGGRSCRVLAHARDELDPVVGAAIEWWRSHRPTRMSPYEHLLSPTVGCVDKRDRQLALVIARRLRVPVVPKNTP